MERLRNRGGSGNMRGNNNTTSTNSNPNPTNTNTATATTSSSSPTNVNTNPSSHNTSTDTLPKHSQSVPASLNNQQNHQGLINVHIPALHHAHSQSNTNTATGGGGFNRLFDYSTAVAHSVSSQIQEFILPSSEINNSNSQSASVHNNTQQQHFPSNSNASAMSSTSSGTTTTISGNQSNAVTRNVANLTISSPPDSTASTAQTGQNAAWNKNNESKGKQKIKRRSSRDPNNQSTSVRSPERKFSPSLFGGAGNSTAAAPTNATRKLSPPTILPPKVPRRASVEGGVPLPNRGNPLFGTTARGSTSGAPDAPRQPKKTLSAVQNEAKLILNSTVRPGSKTFGGITVNEVDEEEEWTSLAVARSQSMDEESDAEGNHPPAFVWSPKMNQKELSSTAAGIQGERGKPGDLDLQISTDLDEDLNDPLSSDVSDRSASVEASSARGTFPELRDVFKGGNWKEFDRHCEFPDRSNRNPSEPSSGGNRLKRMPSPGGKILVPPALQAEIQQEKESTKAKMKQSKSGRVLFGVGVDDVDADDEIGHTLRRTEFEKNLQSPRSRLIMKQHATGRVSYGVEVEGELDEELGATLRRNEFPQQPNILRRGTADLASAGAAKALAEDVKAKEWAVVGERLVAAAAENEYYSDNNDNDEDEEAPSFYPGAGLGIKGTVKQPRSGDSERSHGGKTEPLGSGKYSQWAEDVNEENIDAEEEEAPSFYPGAGLGIKAVAAAKAGVQGSENNVFSNDAEEDDDDEEAPSFYPGTGMGLKPESGGKQPQQSFEDGSEMFEIDPLDLSKRETGDGIVDRSRTSRNHQPASGVDIPSVFNRSMYHVSLGAVNNGHSFRAVVSLDEALGSSDEEEAPDYHAGGKQKPSTTSGGDKALQKVTRIEIERFSSQNFQAHDSRFSGSAVPTKPDSKLDNASSLNSSPALSRGKMPFPTSGGFFNKLFSQIGSSREDLRRPQTDDPWAGRAGSNRSQGTSGSEEGGFQSSLTSTKSSKNNDKSYLECVAELLKGFDAFERVALLRLQDAFVWLDSDMNTILWRRKASTGDDGAKTHSFPLSKVTKLRRLAVEVQISWRSTKGALESTEFVLENRVLAKIVFAAFSCLVPLSAQIKNRALDVGRNLSAYNLFGDTWLGEPVITLPTIGDYILLNEIGSGAFGSVLLSISKASKRFYAVKVMSCSFLKKNVRQSAFFKVANGRNAMGIQDLREIAIMKKLDHPNVMKLHSLFIDEENDALYMIMEYMSHGVVLNCSKMTGAKALSEDRARCVFSDALAGLAYLHSNRIAHRDFKPDNLLSRADGTVKICDFGCSKWYPDTMQSHQDETRPKDLLQRTKTMVGTPAFCAPEDCASIHAPKGPYESFAADVWSLGATLYYLLFGSVPFTGSNAREISDNICQSKLTFPSKPVVSAEAKDLLRTMLVKSPFQRPTLDVVSQHPWVKQAMKSKMSLSAHAPSALTYSEEEVTHAILSIRAALAF
eukprot:CAMPEP_0182451310 /NCGR_PEP_ID=MMETSP1172-20130603/43650_1 /TAXON_ID=708627 /ORGANISM="Timspurckia oligopyrenoides, Strain CCMP3278" /LENGTH=1472 /DNA_ID=CAMNT_0024649075 /DNA_START=146 /DNA_END=4564 /DNA_ORIENTATION=+